ncbi:MAG TPA: hypothetical protein VF432_08685 [Thermoanaerobaculia bacterium]
MKRSDRRNDGRQRVSGYAGPALLTIAALLLVAPFLQAQLHPMPGSKNEPPVLCTGCKGTNFNGQKNDGLRTYPYSSPIRKFVGRYVDSTSTASFQGALGFRTARARYIRTVREQRGSAPPRMYIVIGNAVVGYALDPFFTQMLPAGMQTVRAFKTGTTIRGVGRNPPEDALLGHGFFYPEAKSTKWFIPLQDDQDNIGGGAPFDFDDRGHIYGAYTFMGWGVVQDDGRTDGLHFPALVQMISHAGATGPITKKDTSGFSPESVVAMKVGATYHAVTASAKDRDAVWDVTNPASPRLLLTRRSPSFGIRRFDRNEARKHVAIITGNRRLRVYEYGAFVGGNNPVPVYENTGSFVDVSYDESGNLWAAERENRIWKFTPTARGYTPTTYAPHPGKFDHLAMHVAAGHIFVQGKDHTGGLAYDARLLKIEPAAPRNIDLDGFFRKYYHRSPINHAMPAGNTSPEIMGDVQIVKSGGKTYLMYSTIGLGDVFEIDGGG